MCLRKIVKLIDYGIDQRDFNTHIIFFNMLIHIHFKLINDMNELRISLIEGYGGQFN